MAKDRDSYERLYAGNVFKALALLKTGRAAEARDELSLALDKSRQRYGEENYGTAEVRGFLAMARLAEGDREGALKEFAEAGKVLLAGTHQSDGDGSTYLARDRRLALILGAYMSLLADIRGTALEASAGLDSAAEAFKLGNIARSRSVQRALSASGARAAIKDPALAELARREQDTQKQITALFGALSKSLMRPTADQDSAYIEGVKDTIEKLRAARVALKDEIGRRFPEYAQLIDPKPATIGQARTSLDPGEALIVTYTSPEETVPETYSVSPS